jgi:flagellar biosynthesis/type III secretory pathway protein FliH
MIMGGGGEEEGRREGEDEGSREGEEEGRIEQDDLDNKLLASLL